MTVSGRSALYAKARDNIVRLRDEAIADAARHAAALVIMGAYAGVNEEYPLQAEYVMALGLQRNQDMVAAMAAFTADFSDRLGSLADKVAAQEATIAEIRESQDRVLAEMASIRALLEATRPPGVEGHGAAPLPDPTPSNEPEPAPPRPAAIAEKPPSTHSPIPPVTNQPAPKTPDPSVVPGPVTGKPLDDTERMANAILGALGTSHIPLAVDDLLGDAGIKRILAGLSPFVPTQRKKLVDALNAGVQDQRWVGKSSGAGALYSMLGKNFDEQNGAVR